MHNWLTHGHFLTDTVVIIIITSISITLSLYVLPTTSFTHINLWVSICLVLNFNTILIYLWCFSSKLAQLLWVFLEVLIAQWSTKVLLVKRQLLFHKMIFHKLLLSCFEFLRGSTFIVESVVITKSYSTKLSIFLFLSASW